MQSPQTGIPWFKAGLRMRAAGSHLENFFNLSPLPCSPISGNLASERHKKKEKEEGGGRESYIHENVRWAKTRPMVMAGT